MVNMKLKAYLEETGTKAGDFARTIGVNERESVRRYISGARIPTPSVMRRIIRATDGRVSATDFFDPELTTPVAAEA